MTGEKLDMGFHNLFVSLPLDDSERTPEPLLCPLVKAHYLYISVPFRITHSLPVIICIVPFSMPAHRGQIFYHVEAFYSPCCQNLDKKEFMPAIASTTQKVYSTYMRHHTWNFDVENLWQQIQIPMATRQEDLTCSKISAQILKHLTDCPEIAFCTNRNLRQIQPEVDPSCCIQQQSLFDESSTQGSESRFTKRSGKTSTKGTKDLDKARRTQNQEAKLITKATEEFLESFRNKRFSEMVAGLHNPLSDVIISESRYTEPAMLAFKCCTSMVAQTNEQLKYATFTRFISLCFFLIWETLACEPGKAGARVINAKMREAGFVGTSKSLKTPRDETVFINQIVASVEKKYGIGIASLVFYHIFDSSNYHLLTFT